MTESTPQPGLMTRILFTLFRPVTAPLADMQARLARIEQRVEPLEEWFRNLNQWAYDEGERSKHVIRQLELLRQIRAELNAGAQVVTESSVYFERAVRELLDQRPQADAAPARPQETARTSAR